MPMLEYRYRYDAVLLRFKNFHCQSVLLGFEREKLHFWSRDRVRKVRCDIESYIALRTGTTLDLVAPTPSVVTENCQ